MASKTQRSERRQDALSKERIVRAAIEILDEDGETALTFRALAARLETGSGAIYWHVADKSDLLAAATDEIISRAVPVLGDDVAAREAIRIIALGVYDASEAHRWVGAQLSSDPDQPCLLRIFEGIGSRLLALDVPEAALFDSWSALVNYILGVAAQNAAHISNDGDMDRIAVLSAIADRWGRLDPTSHPFLRRVAAQLPGHDDREQFLAGLDLILAGVETLS